jgi:hypothetical protein
MWYAWERRVKFAMFLRESQKESDRSGDREVDGRMGSEWILGRLPGGGGVNSGGLGY